MRMTISDCVFEVLGDPHRGRAFRNGVPIHRIGDREKMQAETFTESLIVEDDVVAHICVGDLFDKADVSKEVVSQVADEYQLAAHSQKGVSFFCLAGNHDISRDTLKVSSFQLFTRIVDKDIFVIREKVHVHYFENRAAGTTCMIGLIPWHPLKTALEMVDEFAEQLQGCDAVFGHWDVDRRLEGTDNYIPAERLSALGIPLAITGHDHTARELAMAGLQVIVTGSMQPYSHAEDPEGNLYETRTVEDVQLALASNPNWFADKCLRVVGEWDDPWPNCLQFTVKAGDVDMEADEALAQVELAEFNMAELWERSFQGIDPEISADLKAKFAEIGGEEE